MTFKKIATRLTMITGAAMLSTVSAFAQPVAADAEVAVSQVKASVIAVDAETHQVVLKGPEGAIFTVHAGPVIKKFDEIKVGDNIVLTQTDAVVVDIAKPEEGQGIGIEIAQAVGTAPENAPPAGEVIDTIRLTGEIVRLDVADGELTLRGPEGRVYNVQTKNDEQKAKLKELKIGELLQVTFQQSIAVAVTR
ncbi:hypothetical protein ACT6QG_05800 [Xanthobacter sp. TB0136]|uniref:hypothetical protein n=1 Tax=Xanthobacter sp. TB0136 TaxID=3459177 RepID=UPI004039155B